MARMLVFACIVLLPFALLTFASRNNEADPDDPT
jgi:hypothetical protein